MVRRLLRTLPAFVLLLALPVAASARSAAPQARAPMTIVGVHVESSHGAKAHVHVHKKSVWVRVTGKAHQKAHLVIDGRSSSHVRQVPFLARVSAATMAVGAHTIAVATADGAKLSHISFAVVRRTPTIKVVIAPPIKSHSRTARFAWKTAGTSTKSTCRLDNGRFVACSSPHRYTGLKLGSHMFNLKVETAAGTTTLQRGWVVTAAAAAPTVTFLTKPASSTTSTEARFTWKNSGTASRTLCRLDAGTYQGCSQPVTVRNLRLGSHTFDVLATIYGRTASARAGWTVVKAAAMFHGRMSTSAGA